MNLSLGNDWPRAYQQDEVVDEPDETLGFRLVAAGLAERIEPQLEDDVAAGPTPRELVNPPKKKKADESGE